ncbi:hypothetical protein PAXRUDRAFT_14416 [Paxillus rubicundulus Ve08.2h10]|uniref:Uncharacterized protein n=1 Tax=Paxillus rubicundulus Ve08.2h10 TaxID=930991 RepID=A0A0D0DEC3_9AGAM|nr:hypothetical protein PAXRUDRAFT_14416 [Paxillus rubicundulus Ve08.2h10]
MSADLFNMITEQPEVSAARNEYETAIGDLRAQVMTAPDEGMFEEQEMWCLEWQKRLTHLTMALRADGLRGLGLGVLPKDAPSFATAHDMWKRWGVEATIRRQEAEEQEVAAREAREHEEEQIREEERARAAGLSEVGGEAEMGGPAERFQEAGNLEEDASAMVVSPAATPTRKGKGRDPWLSITVPLCKHLHSEAFDKGRKQGEEGEEEDNLAGDKVTEATACDESRGNTRRVVGNAIRRKGDQCTTCEEKKRAVCLGEDGRVCRRCQLKWVACSMSIKAKRDREVSETSGASKVKGKGKGKAHPSEPVPDMAGLSQIAGPACMAGGSNTMARLVDDVVEIELLEYEGVSGIPNETINAVLSLVGWLAAWSLSIDAQLWAAKARLQDTNAKVRDAIEGQKRYREQLAALESQVARLVREAQACPLKDTLVFE